MFVVSVAIGEHWRRAEGRYALKHKITYILRRKNMAISDKVIDELLKDYNSPDDMFGEHGILKQLNKRLIEKIMEGELTNSLGYSKHSNDGNKSGNSRNGTSKKTIKSDLGTFTIDTPRDRNGDFQPCIIPKNKRIFNGFEDKIISMYASGMTTRQIQGQLIDLYGVEVSPGFISDVTNAVLEDVKDWRSRPLDPIYPIVYLDAICIKIRDEGRIIKKSVYVAIGVNLSGKKDLLGLWIAQTEGARFWLNVINELHTRGIQDIFICCVDGLKGFPDAIRTVFPDTEVQLCIVHMIRNSLKYVSYKDRKQVVADLKAIYSAVSVEVAEVALDSFANKWDSKYSSIAKSWRNNWEDITPFFKFPDDIKRAIYTTNTIESLNSSLRKLLKNRGPFPSDNAVFKLFYLGIRKLEKRWTMPIRNWKAAINQFIIFYEDRVPL